MLYEPFAVCMNESENGTSNKDGSRSNENPSPVSIGLGSGASCRSLKLHIDCTIPGNTAFTRKIKIQTLPPSPLIVVMYHLNLTVEESTIQLNPLDEGSARTQTETVKTLTLTPSNNTSCGKRLNGSCFGTNHCPTPHYSNLNSYSTEFNITINHKPRSTTAMDHIEFCLVVTPFSRELSISFSWTLLLSLLFLSLLFLLLSFSFFFFSLSLSFSFFFFSLSLSLSLYSSFLSLSLLFLFSLFLSL